MKITLYTESWYDAAHHLENYAGKCKNLHGHTYKVEAWIRGDSEQLDKAGILWDFGNLKGLTGLLDHSPAGDLNNIIKQNSTAENQVLWMYEYLKKTNKNLEYKIRVYEQLEPKRSYAEVGDFE